MDYELNYELMTASNLIMEGIKWKIENLFQFFNVIFIQVFIFFTGTALYSSITLCMSMLSVSLM